MTNDVKGDALAATFSMTHKKQGMDYVTGEQVTSRLNDVLGWNGWSLRVLEHGYNEEADEVWALVEFIADGTIKHQFGSQKHNRYAEKLNNGQPNPNAGKIIDYGFDLKGAVTDAMKKCASLAGVGLYLQEKAGTPARTPAPQAAKEPKPTFVQYAVGLGFTADEVIAVTKSLYDLNDPNGLAGEQKKRVLVALEEHKKKEVAA
jgi:hypothetical protein